MNTQNDNNPQMTQMNLSYGNIGNEGKANTNNPSKITGENRRNLRIKQLSNPLYAICQYRTLALIHAGSTYFKESNMVHPKEKLRFNMGEEFHPLRDTMDYLHKIFHPAYNHLQEYIMIKQMIYKTRTEVAKT